MNDDLWGFSGDEIRTDEPTRGARLKWVVVVDVSLTGGRAANAVACVAAATSPAVSGLLARGGPDGDGSPHMGLPWAGCSVLAAEGSKLRSLREKAARRADVLLVDMPVLAQEARVYDDYLAALRAATGEEIAYAALSLVGPRKSVDRLVGGLALLP